MLLSPSVKTCSSLPWRKDDAGKLRILLISRRQEHDWTIPTASLDGVTAPAEIAQRAAFRQAGLIGISSPLTLADLSGEKTRTEIFPMRVRGTLVAWPERSLWKRDWVSASTAVKRIADPELSGLIEMIAADPDLLREEVSAPGRLDEYNGRESATN
jgi:ADP-ribose pyrophosphatase YjhB (NUDIX family)